MAGDGDHGVNLEAELAAVARSRIVRGAVAALSEHGLGVSIEEIAAAAGVGRRTVFRHFGTRDQLIAVAITEMWQTYDARVPRDGPPDAMRLEEWLAELASLAFDLNTTVLGRAFWDIHGLDPRRPPEQQGAIDEGMSKRRGWVQQITEDVWAAGGSSGEMPAWLVDAILLLLSAFATNSLAANGLTPSDNIRIITRMLQAVVDSVQ